ncbi:retrotransposon protein, putative, Ty3-gypsy sub-class [Cucumis melo var. makuwa]|uniref:Retrotransposon protein, putative, Ty3-gypsy sub-class n=1 Tax=Cucumis melo var. makuwa TaxID=1194695 RepID=A0A5D3DSN0_CUCMM|nr:retrotransposon protein, putative, Ty3-gypsy sub-class [Cucumis melo var. makuwa]
MVVQKELLRVTAEMSSLNVLMKNSTHWAFCVLSRREICVECLDGHAFTMVARSDLGVGLDKLGVMAPRGRTRQGTQVTTGVPTIGSTNIAQEPDKMPSNPHDPFWAKCQGKLKVLEAANFEGTTNSADVEKWLCLIEKCFREMECPKERKEFRKALQSKFYPRFFFNANRNEFMSLVQGYTNVAEYQKKFTELAKYALGFVIDETENLRDAAEEEKNKSAKGGLCSQSTSSMRGGDRCGVSKGKTKIKEEEILSLVRGNFAKKAGSWIKLKPRRNAWFSKGLFQSGHFAKYCSNLGV